MTETACDICGKKMHNPVRGYSPGKGVDYMTHLNRDFCMDCNDKLNLEVRSRRFAQERYVLQEAQRIYTDTLFEMCKD